MSEDEKLALDIFYRASTRYYSERINQLEDVLRALLDDDNEETRAAARRALEC